MHDHYFPELFSLYRQELTGEFAKARAIRAARDARRGARAGRGLTGHRIDTGGPHR